MNVITNVILKKANGNDCKYNNKYENVNVK